MADDHHVSIVAWPQDPATLAHRFDADEPIAASISFADTPVRVIVSTEPSQPVAVDMDMHVTAREPIPLCIKLCEPLCAKSDYTIGINIFDNPFASITVRGMTRLFGCRDEPSEPKPQPQPDLVCVRFDRLQPGTAFSQPVTLDALTFGPLGGALRVVTFGEPAGRIKLGFETAGIRIEFPAPVGDVRLMLNNYGEPELQVTAYSGTSVLTQFTAHIANTVREVPISQPGITAVTVSGGNREATLVQVCYSR